MSITPYYENDGITIYHGDCMDILPLECDAVVVDPPYNIGKAAWDKIDNYLEWCERWIALASQGCKRQGAFWCFHSEPDVLVDISRIIEKQGKPRQNWITWDKYNETGTHALKGFLDGYTVVGSLRRYQDFAEYIVYHADDGQWTAQSDECRGFIFEPLRAYLDGERKRAGWTKRRVNQIFAGPNVGQYWWQERNWQLPIRAHYEAMQTALNAQGGEYLRREYEDLRREYESLWEDYEGSRRQYEHLRPTFNNPGKVSSVWQYPPAKANGHATPKPVELMERIVESTTNPGDLVLDPFMGSGTTLVAAKNLGRRAIGIEVNERYCEMAVKRIAQEVLL